MASDQQTAQIHYLTPATLVERRISNSALTHYLTALLLELTKRFETPSLADCSFQVSILLSQDTEPVFEVQHLGLPPEHVNLKDDLERELPKVSWPPLHCGAVGVVIRIIHESMSANQIEFFDPFSHLSPPVAQKSESAIDVAIGKVVPKFEVEEYFDLVPAPRSKWKRIRDWITRRPPKQLIMAKPDPDTPLLQQAVDHLKHSEIDQLVDENPNQLVPLVARANWHFAHQNFEKAFEDCNKAIELDVDEPRLFYVRGCYYAETGNTAQALVDVEKAIEISDRFSVARFLRARILIELGAVDEAREELKRCLALRPFEPEYRRILSQILLQSGETQAALEAAEQVTSFDPHCPLSISWKAFLYRQLNRFDDAEMQLADLTRAIALAPDQSIIRFERATWNSIVGNWQSAVDDCNIFLNESKANAEVLGVRANGYLELGEFEKAQADIEQVIELGHTTPQVRMTKIRCDLAAGETATVLEQLDSILDEAPQYLYAICLKGDYFASIGESEDALGCFRDALRIDPKNAFILEKMGYVLYELDQTTKSLETFEKCIDLDGSVPQFHFARSCVLLKVNRLDHALKSINSVIELDPQNPGAYYHRAKVLMAMTNRSEAIENLNRAIEIAPDYGEAVEFRGRLHRDDTNFELAEQDYDRLVNQFPDNFYAYSLRAGFRSQTGQDNLASKDLRTAIELNPAAAEAILLQQELICGEAHFKNEEFDKAIEAFSEAICKDGECLPAFSYRAASYWYSEQFVEALDDYSHVLDRLDDPAEASKNYQLSTLSSRGQVFAELGEYERAIEDLDQVIQADSKDAGPILKAYALNGRGLANAGLAKLEEAEQDFRESISIAPDNSWVHYNQGLFYYEQAKFKKAKHCFELAIELTNPKLTPRKRKKAEGFLLSFTD